MLTCNDNTLCFQKGEIFIVYINSSFQDRKNEAMLGAMQKGALDLNGCTVGKQRFIS